MIKKIIPILLTVTLLCSGCATSKQKKPAESTTEMTMEEIKSGVNMTTDELLKLAKFNEKYVSLPKDYQAMKVDTETPAFTQKGLREYIDGQLSEIENYKPIDKKTVEKNDIVQFSSDIGEGEKQNNYLTVNNEQDFFFNGKIEEIIGKKVGDSFEIKVEYPAEEAEEGSTEATSEVIKGKILNICKSDPITYDRLTDELVKENFGETGIYEDCDTVDKYSKIIEKEYKEVLAQEAEEKNHERIMSKLINDSKFSIPEDMIKKTVEEEKEILEEQAAEYGVSVDELKQMYTEQGEEAPGDAKAVENTLKENLVKDALIKDLKIKVDEKEFDAWLEEGGAGYFGLDSFYEMYEGKDQTILTYARTVAEQTAVDIIIENNK